MLDLSTWRKGINVPQFHTITDAQLDKIAKQKYDHVRILPVGTPTFPGDQVVRRENNLDILKFYNRLQSRRRNLKLIVATESWAQEHTKWFNKCLSGDFSHLDEFLLAVADTMAKFDPKRTIWEIISEPGWFFRDTLTIPGWESHEVGRRESSLVMMKWFDHILPLLRKKVPEMPFLLCGPGWGSPCGPGEWQDLDISKWAKCAYRVHLYAPRNLTHQDGSQDFPYKNYIWPDKYSIWKLITEPSKVDVFDYEFDRKVWSIESIAEILDGPLRKFGTIFVSEYGSLDVAANREAVIAYKNDVRKVLIEKRIPGTEWRWSNG